MDLAIRVLVYQPGMGGEVREIPNTMETLQELVGGCFEMVFDDAAEIHLSREPSG